MKTKDRTELIATKVTHEAKLIFEGIANRLGLVSYGMLNLMVSSVIRMADGWHYCDPELEKLIHLFNHFVGWDSMTSVSDGEQKELVEAVYIFTKPGKKGRFAMLAKDSMFERCTYNGQTIFDEVLKAVDPYLFKFLHDHLHELDCNSTLEAIHELVVMHQQDPDDEYIAELFSDCNRGDFGQKIEFRKYVPHNRRTMNNEQGHKLQTPDMFATMDESGNTKED